MDPAYKRALEVTPEVHRPEETTIDVIVNALTDPIGWGVQCEERGMQYTSHDFRDAPRWEEHLAALDTEWGDPEHDYHATLQLLKVFAQDRRERTAHIDRCRRFSVGYTHADFSTEVVWRRVHGMDVFLTGILHDGAYYQQRQQFFQDVTRHVRTLVLEGFQTIPAGHSLDVYWEHPAMQEEFYARLIHDAYEQNPAITFVEGDPRDDTTVMYDEQHAAHLQLPQEFIERFYTHLATHSPSITEKITEPRILHKLLQAQAHDYVMQQCTSFDVIQQGTFYSWYPHHDVVQGKIAFSLEQQGLEFGSFEFRDAVTAQHLHEMIEYAATRGLPVQSPILDIQGIQHLDRKRFYFDNPVEGTVKIMQHPHLMFLPQFEDKERMQTPAENHESILQHLAAGVFDIDPLRTEAPDGLYYVRNCVIDGVHDGKLRSRLLPST
ncbi:MAG: hypothetical protein OXR66_04740 [Candidatus Woesearchaeota archaeon]|nr:hypothetical protein [Candidatus Woesearchaeota archaeon]